MGIKELFVAGGVVMWPLLGFSVVALALIVERVRFWYRVNTRQAKVVREILNLYRMDNVVGAIEKSRQNADLPIPRIFLAALELEEPTPEEFRLALESEAQAELPILKRFNTICDTSSNPEAIVAIGVDRKVEHGEVVTITDRVRQVKGARLAIATQKP